MFDWLAVAAVTAHIINILICNLGQHSTPGCLNSLQSFPLNAEVWFDDLLYLALLCHNISNPLHQNIDGVRPMRVGNIGPVSPRRWGWGEELKTAQVPAAWLYLHLASHLNGHLIGNGPGGDITATYVLIFPTKHEAKLRCSECKWKIMKQKHWNYFKFNQNIRPQAAGWGRTTVQNYK